MIINGLFEKAPAFAVRFFARCCDYCLILLSSITIIFFLPVFLDFYLYLILVLLLPLCWIPIEALLISRVQTTPGKALFGIQVTDALGRPLPYKISLRRALFFPPRPGHLRVISHPWSRRLFSLVIIASCLFGAMGGKWMMRWSTGLEKGIAVDGWVQYYSEKAGFTVALPEDPKEEWKEVPIPNSDQVIAYEELTSHQSKDIYYSVSYMQLPSKWHLAGANTLLKGALDLIVKHGPPAKILDKKFGIHQNRRSLNFVLREGDKHVMGRLILVGDVLYKLTIVYPPSLSEEVIQDNPFLDSFDLDSR